VADSPGSTFGEPHLISVIIPVYQGENTLELLLGEMAELTTLTYSPDGHPFRITETLLVYDNGPDDSARVIRELSRRFDFVRPIWLSKNFGQHAATLAGMASSGGDWIVTLDEDGQHNPRDIGRLLDTAMADQSEVVYARPTNPAPHGLFRNASSKGAKWLLTKIFAGSNAPEYQSFRLVLGNIGRSVAAYSGSGVYLDVAMSWVAGRTSTSPVELRDEGERRSGYSTRRLLSHFWRMVLSSGTRGLRFVSVLGVGFAIVGVIVAIFILISRLTGVVSTAGWASTTVFVLVGTGAILFSLGIIAEYIGVSVNMSLGKPPYLITTDRAAGPLGRTKPIS
jgi:polyisoprenyl-phosphate glycosyltransferase